MFTKISICLFLLRIVSTKGVTRVVHALIACLIVFTAVCVFLFLGICRPLKAYWDVGVDGVCLSKNEERNIILAQGGNFVTLSRNLFATIDELCSIFNHHRSHLCGIPHIHPEEASNPSKDQGWIMRTDGSRCNVGWPMVPEDLLIAISVAVCCTVRTVLSSAITKKDLSCL